MNKSALFLFLFLLALNGKALALSADCPHTYLYFDLGQTLVDTDTNAYNPMFMMKGAADYLDQLKQAGFPVGLISDVPESWGRDLDELKLIKDYPTAKWMRLIDFVQARFPADHTGWTGTPFDPTWFGNFENSGADLVFKGHVLLPLTDAERKKNGSLVLFRRAIDEAKSNHCPALFMGEDSGEIAAAHRAGMFTFQVGKTLPNSFYLPIDQIDSFVTAHAGHLRESVEFGAANSKAKFGIGR